MLKTVDSIVYISHAQASCDMIPQWLDGAHYRKLVAFNALTQVKNMQNRRMDEKEKERRKESGEISVANIVLSIVSHTYINT